MQSKLIHESNGQRTFVLVFESGDEVMQELRQFADQLELNGSHFTAIGAFNDLNIAFFDWNRKKYMDLPVREQVEVLMMSGDIADDNGQRRVHAHVVVGKSTGEALGGHLQNATVRPTLELVLTESPVHLKRKFDPESGLALIQLR
jgi:predicted DNA-binding protein with PD1-like motif